LPKWLESVEKAKAMDWMNYTEDIIRAQIKIKGWSAILAQNLAENKIGPNFITWAKKVYVIFRMNN